jgi:hypothetical protein
MKRFRFVLAATILPVAMGSSVANLDNLTPVRWQGGPLVAARRAASSPAAPELASALGRWYQPWSLDLLRDTPFNCILVTWADDNATALERDQQRIVREYAGLAHQRGIAVMAVVPSAAALSRTAAAAADSGLDGLVLDGEFAGGGKLVADIHRVTASRGHELPIIILPKAATAPGIRLFSEGGAVQATPTSEPWIDSNLWLAGLLKERDADAAWLGHELKKPSGMDYTRAIADAAAAGGRWVVALDDALVSGLAAGTPPARLLWRQIAATARFFEQHADWRRFRPVGPLGILHENTDMAAENINLITRRKIPYRLLNRTELSGRDLAGFSAVLAVGCALTEGEKAALSSFAQGGGLAIVGPGWGNAVPKGKDFEERQLGKGRIVVYHDDEPDPESLSKDVLHLMGKDHLGVRLFHALTVLPTVRESGDGRELLIGMVNYASEPADAVMIRLAGDYQGARLFRIESAPVALELEKSEGVTEVRIPSVPVYVALVLER